MELLEANVEPRLPFKVFVSVFGLVSVSAELIQVLFGRQGLKIASVNSAEGDLFRFGTYGTVSPYSNEICLSGAHRSDFPAPPPEPHVCEPRRGRNQTENNNETPKREARVETRFCELR